MSAEEAGQGLTPEALAAIAGAGALDAELQEGQQPPPEALPPGQLDPEAARLAAIQGWQDLLSPVVSGTAEILAPGWGLHENPEHVGALAGVWSPVFHKWMPESISATIERIMGRYALEYTALTVTLAILKTYHGKPLQTPPAPPPGVEPPAPPIA